MQPGKELFFGAHEIRIITVIICNLHQFKRNNINSKTFPQFNNVKENEGINDDYLIPQQLFGEEERIVIIPYCKIQKKIEKASSKSFIISRKTISNS